MAWSNLRAVLVALHLVAITLMALPSPGSAMNRSAWKEPTVQDEFRAWTARLNRMGIDWTPKELEKRLWALAKRADGVEDTVLTPFRPYYRCCGTWQSWKMFVAPHRHPARLHIEVSRGDGWEPLYIARDPEHDWHAQQLDHDRMRAALFRYAWSHYRRDLRRFGAWVARTVAEEDPTARRVRLRYYKYRTRTPREVQKGIPVEGHFQRGVLYDLRDYR